MSDGPPAASAAPAKDSPLWDVGSLGAGSEAAQEPSKA